MNSVVNMISGGVATATTTDNAVSSVTTGQTPTTLSSVAQIAAATASVHPAGAFALSPMAATVTSAKIHNDIQNGSNVSSADIISVTGNVLAVIGGVAVLINPVAVVAGVTVGSSLMVATLITAGVGILGISQNRGWIDINQMPIGRDIRKMIESPYEWKDITSDSSSSWINNPFKKV